MAITTRALIRLARLIPGYDPWQSAGDCTFVPAEALAALEFIEGCCTHVKGTLARKPLRLERWQKAIVINLFGWQRPDGTRRYREAFIYVPRKNGKTTLIAAILGYVIFCDGEPGAEIYSAAADRAQAKLVFQQVAGMIRQEPGLDSIATIYMNSIVVGGSTYQAISAEAGTKHGYNSHLVVVDELHAQPNRELVDALATGMGSRRQPLIVYITTADFMRASICNEKYDHAGKVRDGIVEDRSFLPVIYEAKREDDWTKPATWRKANPNLGVSLGLEYMRRECQRAQETPSYENTFRRLHLNVQTEQDVRWLNMTQWDAGGEEFDIDDLAGQECHLGLDFGWRDDYAALVAVFNVDDLIYVLPWFWLPEDCRRDKRTEPIRTFLAEGLVELTPGSATDIETIYAKINELAKQYVIRSIAIDPANARKQGQDLTEDGHEIFEFIQSKRNFNEPCRILETLLVENTLRHGGNKVMRWMAANAVAETNGLEQIMPKKKLSSEKIDGIVALVMALRGALMAQAVSSSYYEEHELEVW